MVPVLGSIVAADVCRGGPRVGRGAVCRATRRGPGGAHDAAVLPRARPARLLRGSRPGDAHPLARTRPRTCWPASATTRRAAEIARHRLRAATDSESTRRAVAACGRAARAAIASLGFDDAIRWAQTGLDLIGGRDSTTGTLWNSTWQRAWYRAGRPEDAAASLPSRHGSRSGHRMADLARPRPPW